MKRPLLLLLLPLLITANLALAQTPANAPQSENLVLLARIWGFLKYFHPAIATGQKDWDAELLHFLPVYRQLTDQQERNDSLLAWIDRQGIIPACDSCAPSQPKNARLQPDFAWMDNPSLSPALRSRLHYILLNRNTQPNYYVLCQTAGDITVPLFQHEKSYTSIHYPDSSYGTLCLFRFWNAIEYWYPYKYQLPASWENVLRTFLPRMTNEPSLLHYTHDTEELLSTLEDSHGYIVWQQDKQIHGAYMLPFTVKFADKWIVTSFLRDSLATASGIRIGDILDSLDGQSLTAIVKELTPTCPASNPTSLMVKLSKQIIQTPLPESRLTIIRNQHRIDIRTGNFAPFMAALIDGDPAWFPFQKDSAFCRLPGNIAYLNMGRLNRKDSTQFKALIRQSAGLIIDDRQNADEMYGTNASDIVASMILPPHTPFVRFSSTQSSFPGVFRLSSPTDMDLPHAGDPYFGPVVILINANTMSVGEFISMAFRMAPHAILLGAPTAGADGNVNLLALPGGGLAQFTGLGVYYPDGRETQRVGLQPDITVKETLQDYLDKRDVQLEKALLYLSHNK